MKSPSIVWFLLEVPRAILQFVISFSVRNFSTPKTKGDGHPILLIPGFLNNSLIHILLRKYLNRIGYKTYDWGLGWNVGKMEDLEPLSETFQKIHQETGEKVSIIGFSLGGVYAREVAKLNPKITRAVITMGSPFRGLFVKNNVDWLFHLVNPKGKNPQTHPDFFKKMEAPAPVPTLAMYSKTDGVVPWKGCREEKENDMHQNLEINSSHFGFVMHRNSFRAIADFLPQTKEEAVFQRVLGI